MIIDYTSSGTDPKNTGANEQQLEGVVIKHALATAEQEFATAESARTLADWKTGITNKEIVPLYEIEELAVGDTEDTFFEGNSKYKTANGKKIRTFNYFVGPESHLALKSYNDKQRRVYEFTDKQEIKGTTPDNTKVRGQLVTVTVGKRVDAMKDKPAYTPVTLTYADYNEYEDAAVILRPTWSPRVEVLGIFDVVLSLVSASATSLKFLAKTLFGDKVTSLESADVTLVNASDVAHTHTFVEADENGVYEITGTSMANGFKIDIDGVVQKTEASYESTGALTVSGIS